MCFIASGIAVYFVWTSETSTRGRAQTMFGLSTKLPTS